MPARTTRSSTKRKFQRRVAQKLEGLVERGKREVARSARKVRRRRLVAVALAAAPGVVAKISPRKRTKRTAKKRRRATAQHAMKR